MGNGSQLRRVHEKHGLAMYEAQLLEQYLAHAVLAATDATGADFESMERRVRKESMGALMRRLADVVAVPPGFRDRLEAVRLRRNCLAHHYFASRSELLQKKSARTRRVEPGFVIDYASEGQAIGIEITAPSRLSLAALNALLVELGQTPATEADLAPLIAA